VVVSFSGCRLENRVVGKCSRAVSEEMRWQLVKDSWQLIREARKSCSNYLTVMLVGIVRLLVVSCLLLRELLTVSC
jgi:hypothetical protein